MILLDTHVVVWMASGDPRLSGKAQDAIHNARKSERGLAISDITLFELSLLFRKRRFELAVDPGSFLSEVERRFVVLPITANIALQAFDLPQGYPNDPVDRMIGATALVQDLPLITADKEIRNSGAVPTIW
jgi:PIN domain nuclease of toxin-antitoxin system